MPHARRIALAVLAAQAWSLPAHGQDATAAKTPAPAEPATVAADAPADAAAAESPPEEKATNRFIEEIVVTAQKREENLQDVPISVAAFSGEALDARGVNDAKDLQLVTPGLQYGTTSGFSVVYLRGVGSDAFIPSADASVATYVDGVYFPFSHAQAQAFGTVERVEVLKGPQGTLFGRNSTGGAISVITKQPGREFETSVQAGLASENEHSARAYTNVPLTDTLAMNVGAIYSEADSYYHHVTLSLPETITRGARGKLRWQPTDAFDWTVTGYVMRQQGLDSLITEQLSPKPVLALTFPIQTKEYETAASEPGFIDARTQVVSTEMRLNLPWFDTKFIGAIQDIDTQAATDFDATERQLVAYTAHTYAKIETAELQLLSNDTTWGSDFLTTIAGLYYIHSRSGFDPIGLRAGPAIAPLLDSLLPDTLPGLPAYSDFIDALGTGGRVIIVGVLDTESTAGFFQTTAHFTDWLDLTLGGRYQVEDRSLVRSSSNIDAGTVDAQLIDFSGPSHNTSNFSPKAVIDVKPWDDSMFYVSWARGFKSGTYNIVSIVSAPPYIKPEKVTTIEAGMKLTLLDGAMRFNAAVFDNKIKDLQAQVVSLQSGASVSFENAGGATIRGADFDLLWELMPETIPGLVLTVSGCYLDSKYTNYDDASGYDETTGLFFGPGAVTGLPGRDFSGNEVVRSPKWTGNAGLSYTFPVGDGTLEIAADGYYNDGFWYTSQNSPRAEQDDYTILNARVSYLYDPWNLRVTAYGKNVNDGDYYIFQYESDFGTSGTQAAPAAYGLRINWEF